MARTRFQLYRYQLLPRERQFQGDLYGFATLEQLIAEKNNIFEHAILSSQFFTADSQERTKKLIHREGNLFVYKLAISREVSLETKEFSKRNTQTWPSVLLVIWNDPDKQVIAIQQKNRAFQNPKAAVKMALGSIKDFLARQNLICIPEPIFEEKAFWDLARRYEGRINRLEFEIVTPNMASISESLTSDLKAFAKESNAVKSTIAIEAAPGSALDVTPNNKMVEGLTEYSAKGGGEIRLKIRGLKKTIHTSHSTKEIEIDETDISGDASMVVAALREIFE